MKDVTYDKSFIEVVTNLPKFNEYEFWKNLKNRKIILNDIIDDYIVERVIMQILNWNEEDEIAFLEIGSRIPIEIILNSDGGDVYLGLVLCDVIENSKTPIKITTLGTAASMAALTLVSAAKHGMRYAYKSSNILLHDGSIGMVGTSNKVKDHMRYQEKKDKQIKDLVLRNTKITEEKYDEMQDREWWLTAEEALGLGVIDFII